MMPIAVVGLLWAAAAAQQGGLAVTGDRFGGSTLPIVPLDTPVRIEALRARSWTAGDTRRLFLDGDVRVAFGARVYRAKRAVLWIQQTADAQGPVNQIAVYSQRLDGPARRSGMGIGANELLLTARTRGTVTLDVALLEDGRPSARDAATVVARGESRLARHLLHLISEPVAPSLRPSQVDLSPPRPPVPRPGAPVAPFEPVAPTAGLAPRGAVGGPLPLFEPQGVLHFNFPGEVSIAGDPDEDVAIVTGTLVVEYTAHRETDEWHHLTLSAQRAVVFAEPGRLEEVLAGPVGAESIRGIYLEGNVIATADRGRYVVRAPRMYYDLRTNRAIMVEAVLRTYARESRVPIYARAKEMRQLAADQWEATDANVSASEFFEPHFALGMQRVTVTQRPGKVEGEDTQTETYFESEQNTLKLAGVPFFYWPRLSGSIEDVPIKGLTVGSRSNDGVRIETKWDPFVLLGWERPAAWDATVRADVFTKRGGGGGLELSYDVGAADGALDLYGLYDQGIDRTSSGLDVDPEREFRGVALWEHDWRLGDFWRMQAQVSWISDETFITSWRDRDFAVRREYETSLYAVNRRDNAAFTALAQHELNDFISNNWLLASRAYQVDRLPEVGYRRYGDSLFGDTVTYSSQTQISRLRIRPETSTPAQLGVPGEAFGIDDDVPVDVALAATGLPMGYVNRFDSRHEFAMPLELGAIKAVPFVVGRLTAWDEDITFSSDGDKTRVFGAAGVRLGTHIVHVDNNVENRLLGLHRLRHIVEPRVVAWFGYSNISQDDLPVFDESVESTGTGGTVELGVRNTFQSKRGGPGRWYSVDVLTVDAAVVMDTSDVDRESPAPQFFEYRPEYSQFGDHARASAVWLLSDRLSVAGEATYDIEGSLLARASIGTELRHTPRLSTLVEYRYLEASDNELLELAWNYKLTPKYDVSIRPQWDFRAEEFRAIGLRVVRRFPDFDLIIQVIRDEIADQTSFGASIGVVEF